MFDSAFEEYDNFRIRCYFLQTHLISTYEVSRDSDKLRAPPHKILAHTPLQQYIEIREGNVINDYRIILLYFHSMDQTNIN